MGRASNEPPTNPNDLTAISGGPPTSQQEGSRGRKRKQTLLSLLDALAELSKDDELDGIVRERHIWPTRDIAALSCGGRTGRVAVAMR
ncbi:hypothetical protein C8Q80DRAFT_360590 [Daedaleopsis nitida]|nr:hypothetical protein C8Q80DRAFT_360590 [Daedaleopsis nitida]